MLKHDDLIQKLTNCAAACDFCHDSCLDEDDIKKMVECIRLDRDCARICQLAAGFLALRSSFAQDIVKECEKICRACGEECSKHEHDHCKECAKACQECAEACASYMG